MSILDNIPVIDKDKIPKNILYLIDDKIFGDDRLNAYQILRLEDKDNGSSIEIVTKWLRENGINSDRVLINNTW